MKKIHNKAAVLWLACALGGAAAAQEVPARAAPANIVQLSAQGVVEAPQDWLTMRLNTRREGADAQTVQAQLKVALEQALQLARPAARDGALEVRTGGMGLSPRYGRDGQVNGWQGHAELVLEGTDMAAITTLAGRIQSLTVAQVGMGLSRATSSRLEAQAQGLAIEEFKRKAADVAKAFGFGGYSLREVSVGSAAAPGVPFPRVMAMEARAAAADAPVPVEAGKSSVTVVVSGSVQMK